MNQPVLGGLYLVEERQIDHGDVNMGIARRFAVKNAKTGNLEIVVITIPSPGKWSEGAKTLCSCKSDLNCGHKVAVGEAIKHDPDEPPVAA